MFHRQQPALGRPGISRGARSTTRALTGQSKLSLALLLMLLLVGCAGLGGGTPTESQAYGIWSGRLPCADCPGIDTRLVLWRDPDRFLLTETYLDKAAEPQTSSGTWTIERAGEIPELGRLKLTTTSSDRTVYLERLPTGNLRLLDQDGEASNTTLDHVLERTRARTEGD